jgi:pimeloyl-ACP methyl ester carboxylesterase
VDLVGHSMGGTIACLYAATRPERVRRLVLVEGLGPPDMSSIRLAMARRSLSHRRSPPLHRGLASAQAAADRMRKYNPALSEGTALRLARRTLRPVGPNDPAMDPAHPGPLVWTWDPLHRARSPRAFEAAAFGDFLAAIEAPTLLIDGGASRFRPEDGDARRSRIARAQHHVVAEAGHLVHHDDPETLARLIREHFGSE